MTRKFGFIVFIFLVFVSLLAYPVNSTHDFSSYDASPQTLNLNYSPVFGLGSDLSLYLPLSENNGEMAFDCSGHGNNAILPSPILIDGDFHFDGYDDYIQVVNDPTLRSESATWACWFKLDDITFSNRFLIWKNLGGHHFGDIQIKQDENQIFVLYDINGDYQILESNPLEVDLWYHLAVVWDKENDFFGIYINGELVDYSCYVGGTNENLWDLKFGGNGLANQSISGNMKEICVYSSALSPSEVAYHYFSGVKTPRVDPSSQYMIGGWVTCNSNNSSNLFEDKNVLVFLNGSLSTSLDSTGTYLFVFDAPSEVGNYTYEVKLGDSVDSERVFISVIVDSITVSEWGGSSVFVQNEGIAWFRLESAFDGQPITNGNLTLSNGQPAVWNSSLSRWEYKDTFGEEYNLVLTVDSVFWNRYGLSSLTYGAEKANATIYWQETPWYYPLIKFAKQAINFISTIPPMVWGLIGSLILLISLLKLGIITIELAESDPSELLKARLEELLASDFNQHNDYPIRQHIFRQLLKEDISTETLKSLIKYLTDILEKTNNQKEGRKFEPEN